MQSKNAIKMKRLNDKNELNTISPDAGTVESGRYLNSNFGIRWFRS